MTQLKARREAPRYRSREYLELSTPEKLAEELQEWATEGKLAYINSVLEADPTLTYTLTATPNILVSGREVIDLVINLVTINPLRLLIGRIF